VAHEINNPVAATQRGAGQLQEIFFELQTIQLEINRLGLSDQQMEVLLELGRFAKTRAEQPDHLNPLERSDRENEIENWLEERGIDHAWELAPTLVSLGYDPGQLEPISETFLGESFPTVIHWIDCTYTIHRLLAEISHGSSRISEIVKALKSYTYMDQAPIQMVNIHEGLDNTLIILQNKLKTGVTVHRNYAGDLPHIQAHGSELNQVWTNIIDNAIAAMKGQGELTLRTFAENQWVVVEIEDNGPGIPEAAIPKLFDPFFTTKPPGEGTGLGLYISHNIISQKHKGKIVITSSPGRTCFKIKLPITLEAAEETQSGL
jgi:signal transduction histidine kinase